MSTKSQGGRSGRQKQNKTKHTKLKTKWPVWQQTGCISPAASPGNLFSVGLLLPLILRLHRAYMALNTCFGPRFILKNSFVHPPNPTKHFFKVVCVWGGGVPQLLSKYNGGMPELGADVLKSTGRQWRDVTGILTMLREAVWLHPCNQRPVRNHIHSSAIRKQCVMHLTC